MPNVKHSKPVKKQAVKAVIFTGRGAYRTKSAPKARAVAHGGFIRGRGAYTMPKNPSIGEEIGSFLGGKAEQLIRSITGFGDYHVRNNSIMQGGMDPPALLNSIDNGGIIVRHREYLGDINASVNFAIQSYDINPGLPNTFPWLSSIADSFDEYQMRGLVFEFKSLASDAVLSSSTSSALGAVIMATQYNSALPNFSDKKQMENYEFANSSKPSGSFYHPVECLGAWTPSEGNLYIRSGGIPTGTDQRFYDLGNFQIATQGMQAASGVCGELWATYEVCLRKPKLVSGLGTNLLSDHFKLSGTINGTNPFGTLGATAVSGSNLGCTMSATVITFPNYITDGNYLVNYTVKGASTAITLATWTYVGCSAQALWENDTVSFEANSGTSVNAIISVVVKITAASATITFPSSTLPASITVGDVWINQINNQIAT